MDEYDVVVLETRVVRCLYRVRADNERDARGLAEMGDTVLETELRDDGVINRTIDSVTLVNKVS